MLCTARAVQAGLRLRDDSSYVRRGKRAVYGAPTARLRWLGPARARLGHWPSDRVGNEYLDAVLAVGCGDLVGGA